MAETFLFPGTCENPNQDVVKMIRDGITKMNGHCPCIPKYAHNDDTICPCKPYRDSGKCKCSLYVLK